LNLWNPFSVEQSEQLSLAVLSFVQTYYVNNKNKGPEYREKLKDIIIKITEKFEQYIEIITCPSNSNSNLGVNVLALGV
jgi:hypothetical protein